MGLPNVPMKTALVKAILSAPEGRSLLLGKSCDQINPILLIAVQFGNVVRDGCVYVF